MIDFARLKSLNARLSIAYDPYSRAWLADMRDADAPDPALATAHDADRGRVAVEVADESPEVAVAAAIDRFAAQVSALSA